MNIQTDRAFIPAGTATVRYLTVTITAPARERRTDRPIAHVALVLDRSGSMAGRKIDMAKKAGPSAGSAKEKSRSQTSQRLASVRKPLKMCPLPHRGQRPRAPSSKEVLPRGRKSCSGFMFRRHNLSIVWIYSGICMQSFTSCKEICPAGSCHDPKGPTLHLCPFREGVGETRT